MAIKEQIKCPILVAFLALFDVCDTQTTTTTTTMQRQTTTVKTFNVALGGKVSGIKCDQSFFDLGPDTTINQLTIEVGNEKAFCYDYNRYQQYHKFSHWKFKLRGLGKKGKTVKRFKLTIKINGLKEDEDKSGVECIIDGQESGQVVRMVASIAELNVDTSKPAIPEPPMDTGPTGPPEEEPFKPELSFSYLRFLILLGLIVVSFVAVVFAYLQLPEDSLKRLFGWQQPEIIEETEHKPDHQVIAIEGGGVLLVVDDSFMPRAVDVEDIRSLATATSMATSRATSKATSSPANSEDARRSRSTAVDSGMVEF